MPERLQQQLQQLRDEIGRHPPQDSAERAALLDLLQDIERQLTLPSPMEADASLVDGVNLAIERFESEHPTLAGTLRNVLQSLANMGI